MAYDKKYPNINDEILTFDKGQEDRIGGEFDRITPDKIHEFNGDVNNISKDGMYRVVGGGTNTPTGYGLLLHFNHSSVIAIQFFFNNGGKAYRRLRWDNWFEWKEF